MNESNQNFNMKIKVTPAAASLNLE